MLTIVQKIWDIFIGNYCMKRTALIMAGGSGERFWPLSRQRRPKQLLKLTSTDKTMLEEAIERLVEGVAPLFAAEDIFIVTSEMLQPFIRDSVAGLLPPENIVAEPLKRNTAPCIALGVAFITERYAALSPEEISIAVLTADHYIERAELFRENMDLALTHAEQTGELVTFGVKPTRPATGYGYIEIASDSAHSGNLSLAAHRVLRFREKPNVETAQEFIEQGNYYWNSGMFFWRADSVMQALKDYLPEVGIRVQEIRNCLQGETSTVFIGAPPRLQEVFVDLPDISIDYGLMERAKNVACVCVDFGWDDVGSWDALERVYPADDAQNINVGETLLIDSHHCIVMNSAGSENVSVAVIGVNNIVVVTTPDGVLVCSKDHVQDVRKAVGILRSRHEGKFV